MQSSECIEREREFISLFIMNDTRKKISIIYRRIMKLTTGSCEGTSGLRVELQPNIIVLGKDNTKKKIKKQSEMFCDVKWSDLIQIPLVTTELVLLVQPRYR